MNPVPTTHAELSRHYAAVRARLVPPAPRTKLEPMKRPWWTPRLIEISIKAALAGADLTLEDRVFMILRECAPHGERIRVRTIIGITADAFGVSIDGILEHSQKPRYAVPRLVAMTVARHLLAGTQRGTVMALGRSFRRDHSCIINARDRYGSIVERVAQNMQGP